MLKDFMKYRQFLRTQNLSVNEQYMLELLFELHNEQYGYAFPSFEFLLDAFNTTSKNRVSKVLTDLESKGFIKKEKVKRSNRYIVINIKDFMIEKVVESDEVIQSKVEIVEKTLKKKATSKMHDKLETIEVEELKNVDAGLHGLEKINETYYINAIDIYLSNKNKPSNVKEFKPRFKGGIGKAKAMVEVDGVIKDASTLTNEEIEMKINQKWNLK